MRKLKIVLITGLILLSSGLFAQVDVKLNVSGLKHKNLGLSFDYAFKDDRSLGLNGNYTNQHFWVLNDHGFKTYSIVPNAKRYFKPKESCAGLFVGPYMKFRGLEYRGLTKSLYANTIGNQFIPPERIAYNLSAYGVALGVHSGYKIVTTSRIVFELDIGLGRYLYNWVRYSDKKIEKHFKETGGSDSEFGWLELLYLDYDLRLGLNIGYRF